MKKSKNPRAVKKREERALFITVQEAAAAYLASPHVMGLEESTQKDYSKELRAFVRWCSTHTIVQDPKTKSGQLLKVTRTR